MKRLKLMVMILVLCIAFVLVFAACEKFYYDDLISDLTSVKTDEPVEDFEEDPTEKPAENPTEDSSEESTEDVTDDSSDEVDFSKLSMNCLGDSVTRGGGCPTYVPALQEILGVKNCRNYGKSGSTICAAREDPLPFVERYSSMDDDADIILVFGGFNDFAWCSDLGDIDSTDPFTFYGALNTLVVGLQEKYPDAYIFFVTPYKRYDLTLGQVFDDLRESKHGYSYSDLNDAIKAVGQKHSIHVLDLFDLLEIDENSTTDGLHPTEDFANNVLAPTIAQFIKDNYKKPEKKPIETPPDDSSDEVDFSKLSMNCLGDSVTNGNNGNNSCSYIPALQSLLNLENCRNYGKGGSPIADVCDYSFIDRYSSMDDDADIILIFGGFNDPAKSVQIGNIDDTDVTTFYGALNTLVVNLQEKYSDAYIFFVAPYKLFNKSTGQLVDDQKRLDFNIAIRAIGEKYNIDVLDLWDLNVDETSFIDWVHPTEDFANNVLAPTIAQFIKDNYKKPN